jgi:hypothetical protein
MLPLKHRKPLLDVLRVEVGQAPGSYENAVNR